MATIMPKEKTILRDLGDGLILRRATVEDADALAAFNAEIHSEAEDGEPDERVAVWTRDLMEQEHPTFNVGDFTIVEDANTGAIVSSLNLISQTWSYGGIELGVGRPELVGTHPDYRRRGLVRAQFEVIHQWSAARGEKMQAITGIPWYYRQFGYEMGLALGGERVGYKVHVPELKDDESEPYCVRPAEASDLPFIAEVYAHAAKRYLVACVRDEAMWQYELHGRSEKSVERRELRVVESAEGEPVGYLVHPPQLWRPMMTATGYELKPGASWLAVTPSVLRYMATTGAEYAERDQKKAFGAFAFWLGTEHPVYQAIPDRLPRKRDPYAWYVRVPDLPGFLQYIAPVLEQRLYASMAAGHSGELKLNFFREGWRMVFEQGRLQDVEPWQPSGAEGGDALFPDLTFLQLVFGYRAFDELVYAFADCYARTDAGRALLPALFPKQVSNVWPVA